jgi:hypothetical protein
VPTEKGGKRSSRSGAWLRQARKRGSIYIYLHPTIFDLLRGSSAAEVPPIHPLHLLHLLQLVVVVLLLLLLLLLHLLNLLNLLHLLNLLNLLHLLNLLYLLLLTLPLQVHCSARMLSAFGYRNDRY